MTTIIGIITEKSSKPGNTNGKDWTRFVFVIGGKKISSFDTENDKFKVGDNVKAEYKVEGTYNNMVENGLDYSDEVPTPVPANEIDTPTKTATNYTDDTSASIVSQVIIKAVAEMVAGGKIDLAKFGENATALVNVYKETKQKLLE